MQVLLEQLDLGDVVAEQLVEHAAGLVAQLVEQARRPLAEAARDQLGRRREPAGAVRGGERRDDDQHAVLGEPAPVAQRDVAARRRRRGRRRTSCRRRRGRRCARRARRELDDACRSRRAGSVPPGMPASRASCACAASMRNSPCTGITASAARAPSIVRSSSARPCPETCTGALSSCSTSAPDFASRLIASWTRSSLPGIGFAEMITVSPRSTLTRLVVVVRDARQSPRAARPGCRCRGSAARRAAARRARSGGGSRRPARPCSRGCARCSTFLRIERPTNATLRPQSTATSTACCIRCTFDANDATRIAPFALRDDLAERLADDALRLA